MTTNLKKLHAKLVASLDQQEAAILDRLKTEAAQKEISRAYELLKAGDCNLAGAILATAMSQLHLKLAEQTGDLDP